VTVSVADFVCVGSGRKLLLHTILWSEISRSCAWPVHPWIRFIW